MAGITQTTPNYIKGISKQADHLKLPGQVADAKNVLPDLVEGLQKRPGGKFVSILRDIPSDTARWFKMDQGGRPFIGRVDKNGSMKIWDCGTGREYIPTMPDGNQYLVHTNDESIQFLSINAYTFFCNREKYVEMSDTVKFQGTDVNFTDAVRPNEAFISLKKVTYNQQYPLDIRSNARDTENNDSRINTRSKVSKLSAKWESNKGSLIHKNIAYAQFQYTDIITINPSNRKCVDCGRDHANYLHHSEGNTIPASRQNLRFELSMKGTPMVRSGNSDNVYDTHYELKVDIIHGGEGWKVGDNFLVNMGTPAVSDGVGSESTYRITVDQVEEEYDYIDIGYIRPEPTPTKRERTTSATKILNDLKKEIEKKCTGAEKIDVEIIGDGLYLKSNGTGGRGNFEFFVTCPEKGLFDIITDKTTDISTLPSICKDNYIVKIANTEAEEDDYFVEFRTKRNGVSGDGVWEECAAPGHRTNFDASTMPHQLIRQVASSSETLTGGTYNNNGTTTTITKAAHGLLAGETITCDFLTGAGTDGAYVIQHVTPDTILIAETIAGGSTGNVTITKPKATSFEFKQIEWEKRLVGNNKTNPKPSFSWDKSKNGVGYPIQNILFFRNRLALLSEDSIILSQPGDFFNFWSQTAMTVSPGDVVDVSASSTSPEILKDGIEVSRGLLLFSNDKQFMLTTDNDVLTPESAKIINQSAYSFNTSTKPFLMGTTVGFLNASGAYTKMFEMSRISQQAEPIVIEQSKVIAQSLPRTIDSVAESKENGLILLTTADSESDIWCYRYFNTDEKRELSSWFRWRINGIPIFHCIIDGTYYAVVKVGDNLQLQNWNLKNQASIGQCGNTYQIHMDNQTTVPAANMSYNSTTKETTINFPENFDKDEFAQIVIYGTTGTYKGQSVMPQVTGYSVNIQGDWTTSAPEMGYLFDMKVEFPQFYVKQPSSTGGTTSETNSSTTVHRIKFQLGPAGSYSTVVQKKNKNPWIQKHESSSNYNFKNNCYGIVEESERTVPIYSRNTDFKMLLTSRHISPCTLYSTTWEGDVNAKNYRKI